MKNNKGFSLVELIVVVAIMAILAAIAIPTFAHFITKANVANDEELMSNINYIFKAACLENGVDVSEVKSAAISYNENADMSIANSVVMKDGDTELADKIESSFTLHFADMAKEKFKSKEYKAVTIIYFKDGKFDIKNTGSATVELKYGDITITVTQDQIDALKGSAFGEMGTDVLLGKIDYVSNLASSLLTEVGQDSSLYKMLNEDAASALAANLGIDLDAPDGPEKFATAVTDMINKKMDLLIEQGKYNEYEDRSEDSPLYTDAYNQILSNNAVLNAAQNSANVSNDILTVLGSENSKGQIVNTVNQNSGNGLAQASMAYALYTAYAKREGITVPDDPSQILLLIDTDQGFKNYINNTDNSGHAQTDLDGYLASMGMIDSNIDGNDEAVSDILVNGFANEDLIGMLGQVTEDK